ncbi:MAG: response regulator transcription factor [Burkholderiales bacterium]
MNILIVDDHPLTCQGLAALLGTGSSDEPAPHRVASVHSAAAAREALAADAAPDWLFLDVRLPDDPQQALFAELCEGPWAARTVLISAEVPHALVRRALGAGMRGFIPKSADPAMVLAGFATVRRGEVYLPPELAALMHDTPPGAAAARNLSPRLREVLALVLRGASNKVIAREIGLSEYTVKEYMSSILAYHGVGNRLDLVLKLQGDASARP